MMMYIVPDIVLTASNTALGNDTAACPAIRQNAKGQKTPEQRIEE